MSAQTSDSGAESEAPDSSKKEQEDGEELPFIEAFSVMFNVASCLGLHIVRRDDLGVYRISWWKVGTSLLSLINATIGFLTVGYIYLYTGISYYQQVMLLPIVCGCFFYFYGYILLLHTFRDYINYLTVLEANNLKIKKNVYLPLIIIGIAVYSFIYTCCLSLTALLPRETVYELQSILFVISFIPSFLDLHMFSFAKLLITALAKLEKRVRGIEHWTTDDVSLVAQEWLRLCNLFHEHNKNFQYPLRIRLVLLMVQAMTFMFLLVVLRPSKSCLILMLPTLVPLAELSTRFLCVCLVGEILRKTNYGMVEGLREAVCAAPSGDEEVHCSKQVQLRQSLHNLLSRMEARPLTFQIWGMDPLCGSTFVQNTGLVITYLVILLQLRSPFDLTTDSFTFQCFSNDTL